MTPQKIVILMFLTMASLRLVAQEDRVELHFINFEMDDLHLKVKWKGEKAKYKKVKGKIVDDTKFYKTHFVDFSSKNEYVRPGKAVWSFEGANALHESPLEISRLGEILRADISISFEEFIKLGPTYPDIIFFGKDKEEIWFKVSPANYRFSISHNTLANYASHLSGSKTGASNLVDKIAALEANNRALEDEIKKINTEKDEILEQNFNKSIKDANALVEERLALKDCGKKVEELTLIIENSSNPPSPCDNELRALKKQNSEQANIIDKMKHGLAASRCYILSKLKKTTPQALLPTPGGDQATEWVYVSTGRFKMGLSKKQTRDLVKSTRNVLIENEHIQDKQRQQTVDYPFFITKYEITNEIYKTFDTDHQFPSGLERFPVVNLKESQIQGFVAFLDQAEPAFQIDLPNEREWEYAARGGEDERAYPWGDEFDSQRANLKTDALQAVDQAGDGESWCGAVGMAGNAAELCIPVKDLYQEQRTEKLVARGGSFKSNPIDGRVTSRHLIHTPNVDHIGFRLVIRENPPPSSGGKQ